MIFLVCVLFRLRDKTVKIKFYDTMNIDSVVLNKLIAKFINAIIVFIFLFILYLCIVMIYLNLFILSEGDFIYLWLLERIKFIFRFELKIQILYKNKKYFLMTRIRNIIHFKISLNLSMINHNINRFNFTILIKN